MDDIGGVHVEESSEYLIGEVLDVIFGKILPWINDSMEIGFHKFCNDVDISVACSCLWFEKVGQQDDIFVFEEFFVRKDFYWGVLFI